MKGVTLLLVLTLIGSAWNTSAAYADDGTCISCDGSFGKHGISAGGKAAKPGGRNTSTGGGRYPAPSSEAPIRQEVLRFPGGVGCAEGMDRWHVRTYDQDGVAISVEISCRPATEELDLPPLPPSPAEVAALVTKRLPRAQPRHNPTDRPITGLETWLWHDAPTTATVSATIDTWQVTTAAEAVHWRWQIDGITHGREDPGSCSPTAIDCSGTAVAHRFRTKGPRTIRLDVIWCGDYTTTNGETTFGPFDLGCAPVTTETTVDVAEIRGVLTE